MESIFSSSTGSYRVCSIIRSSKVDHAIQACEGSASTLAVMGVKLLLSEDVSTILHVEDVSGILGWSAWLPNGRQRMMLPRKRRRPWRCKQSLCGGEMR